MLGIAIAPDASMEIAPIPNRGIKTMSNWGSRAQMTKKTMAEAMDTKPANWEIKEEIPGEKMERIPTGSDSGGVHWRRGLRRSM